VEKNSKTTRKIGLALGSGGVRGLAHVGVIKSLVRHGIPIDLIAGTSIGALIGGAYACLQDIDQVEAFWQNASVQDLFTILANPIFSPKLFQGDRAVRFLQKKIGRIDIEDLTIPFTAVATDVHSGAIKRISKGDLFTGVRASSSLPFLFHPCRVDGRTCIDGGASEPVPVETVRAMGADIVIAVNLDSIFFPEEKLTAPPGKIGRLKALSATYYLFRYHLARENVRSADIVIDPKVKPASWLKFIHSEAIIKQGEKATDKVIPEIRALSGQ